MKLKTISCINFRNFSKKDFDLNSPLTFIVGENARGKTNLLESVYFITMGEGFRDTKEEELINLDAFEAMVRADFENGKLTTHFQVYIKESAAGTVDKIYTVNKTKKRSHQYLELSTRSVLFSPDQILIMIGPPDYRRTYIDKVVTSYDPEYKKRLHNYENALRRRNKILEHHVNVSALKEELSFWDVYLAEQASYITQAREDYIKFLNAHPIVEDREFEIEYMKNELTVARLEESFEKERLYRRTTIGPQKDDYVISQKEKERKKNLHHFGSRSEQRLAVYWLKLNEARVYEERHKVRPILLLDDIFSELDEHNKRLTLATIHDYQTIMTTTESKMAEVVKKENKIIEL